MAAPTTKSVALSLLRMLGVTDIFSENQSSTLLPGDLDDVAMVMTQTWQVIFANGPGEMRMRPASGVLHAPTTATLTATNASTTISAFTTWASWMEGCTVRITGDDQDNELLSATKLARPYMGTTGSGKSATVYGDCITLDETVNKVASPLMVGTVQELQEATSRRDFINRGGWSMANTASLLPYYHLGNKPTAQYPSVFFLEGFYDPTLDYVPRRLRFSPMPTEAHSVGYTVEMAAPRVTASDITDADYDDSLSAKLPIINSDIESIYLPIAMQLLTRLGTFKNADAKPEIMRQYRDAMNLLQGSQASVASVRGVYI